MITDPHINVDSAVSLTGGEMIGQPLNCDRTV